MKQNFYGAVYQYKTVFFFLSVCIQTGTLKAQSHQDCINAISVCTNTYVQTTSSAGFGNIQEIAAGATCLGNGETNSTWYMFSIQDPGTLLFQIDPLNTHDHYDFVLYKFNGNCTDIVNGTVSPLRCNYSAAAGSTGLAQSSTGISVSSNGLNQCAPITVLQNEKYLLMVNNFTATNSGYTLTFSGTATIYDTEPPELTTTNITSCGPSMAYVYFSESIKCATIAANGSDFKVTGPS